MAWNNVGNIKGPPGLVYRGNYASTTQYVAGDVVFYNYASWVAKVAVKGVTPTTTATTQWGQLAQRGATGPQGIQGVKGVKGDTGPQGLKGDPGPAGVMSAAERLQLFGSTTGTVKPHGSLRWSGPWYNPKADAFTRLRTTGDGRLVTFKDTGGVTATTNDQPRLIAPVSGVYLLSATQTWGNDVGNRGIGLGTSLTAGDVGMVLWQDFTMGRITNATTTAYLTAGTVLYPWIWAPINSGMSPADRGVNSEYAITFLAAGA